MAGTTITRRPVQQHQADESFNNEGIYVSYARTLTDPRARFFLTGRSERFIEFQK